MGNAEVLWDGIANAYIPPAELAIAADLELHTDAVDVDPFLFEILRHNVWNINDEHGMTIIKVSGSPIAYSAEDFSTSIFTEAGEYVFFGPRNQMLSGTMDLMVKWILENRSENPGIRDGDMFLGNDPWIGTTHQQDVALLCPVFWEGRLFCWVGSALHQYDIGGTTPGGFCPDAEDVYMEPVVMPPVKLVEGGEIRADIEQFYLRHSRMRDLVALDLRAQVAGNTMAKSRILALIERYGAEAVKGSMYKTIDDAEQVFASKLELLPDGVFRARSFLEAALDGDRKTYPVALQVEKQGSRLAFTMEGAALQAGALNVSYAAWRSGILTAVNPMLAHDVLYATGGALRRIDFAPVAGTVTCASYPGSVSMAQGAAVLSGALAIGALSRLLSFDPDLRSETFAAGGVSTFLIDSLAGVNQWGKPFGTILLDPMLGATGAFTSRDGIDTGGCWWDPRSISPNVEENEQNFPLLYLYRRHWEDSGGAGRYRGGNSGCGAYVAHGTERIDHSSAAPGLAFPTSEGVFGAGPGSPNRVRFKTETDVQERLAGNRLPADIGDLSGESHVIRPKQRGIVQGRSDVMEIAWGAGGGSGDPLDREPDEVVADVERGAITAAWGETSYGVVIGPDGLDEEATAAARARIRVERLGGEQPSRDGATAAAAGEPEEARRLRSWDLLEVVETEAGGMECRCGRCATRLSGEGEQSYKSGAAMRARPLVDAVPNTQPPELLVDDDFVVREYSCPGCARLLASEVARREDEPLVDIELRAASRAGLEEPLQPLAQ